MSRRIPQRIPCASPEKALYRCSMTIFPLLDSPSILLYALAMAFVAGAVKGAVGFALPMMLISTLSLVVAPDVALGFLILPALITNGVQALRNGLAAAWASVVRFRVFMGVGLVFLVLSAQLVAILPQRALYLLIGGPITLFCLIQLLGWQPKVDKPSTRLEVAIGSFAGFVGGMSGVWGPPTVAYLTAINTPKADQMRAQGVIYGLGAVSLALAHIQSGVLNIETGKVSALLVLPALIGLWAGFQVHDRIDQATFRKATLAVLLLAGLNLVRRGLF